MSNAFSTEFKQRLRSLPQSPGVYIMRDCLGKIIYVGKAKNIKKRVASYFQSSRRHFIERPKLRALVHLVHDIDHIIVKSDTEALVLENKLIKQWQPKFNQDLKDDKGTLWVRVDLYRSFPCFRVEYNNQKDPNALYFGPFIHHQSLRTTLKEMRLKYGILLGDTTPKLINHDQYALYQDARAEIYQHPNVVTLQEYQERVKKACTFLEGRTKDLIQEAKQKMEIAAHHQDFKEAAQWRDVYFALQKTLHPTRQFKHIPCTQNISHIQESLELLKVVLDLDTLPYHIECFDISHISGTFVVASMVCFNEGKPNKKQYRRFKIKSFVGNDDFRAMQEVVYRHYKKTLDQHKQLPHLVVIDGGIGQVHAALKAFDKLNISAPSLIGLAKKQETIISLKHKDPIQLPSNHSAIKLLQRIRDEAHRFAHAFNSHLRTQAIKNSILDDCLGLGHNKKQTLLNHFKTIQAVKKANLEELIAVPGIGPKLAQNILTCLGTKQTPISSSTDST